MRVVVTYRAWNGQARRLEVRQVEDVSRLQRVLSEILDTEVTVMVR